MNRANSGIERRVTAADVARSLGVSRATVGYVLSNTPGQVSEATRTRVLAEAARLGYRPHRGAQDLRRGRSNVVLVVLPDWPMAYRMREHLDEAALVLDEAGYTLVTQHTGRRTRPLWELLAPDVVIGMAPFDDDQVASMRACGITRIVPPPGKMPAPTQLRTLDRGSALQIEHLYELGHRRIGYATTADPRAALLADTRVEVAQRAAESLGLAPLDVRPVGVGEGGAHDAVRRWHSAGLSAVAAYDDDIAVTVIWAALRSGLAVPGDLAVIGHDDTPLAEVVVPSVSSVRIDGAGLGRDFAELALAVAEDRPIAPDHLTAARVDLVPRESTIGSRPGAAEPDCRPRRGRLA
ncbi:LacI family DNA-binding transcriptional regulator [Yinghuangia sp. YIM S10712]|uniref:LacI family DNA-binding transcriptional regulator n=1 Tax=Yinghuangia sp. YIM S10712 TaxID=3436930 RepID=UPI003F539C5B